MSWFFSSFPHVQRYTTNDKIATNSVEPAFNYYFNIKGYRVTAIVTMDPRYGKHIREYSVQYAFCSPKDQFSRKRGRVIATRKPEVHRSVILLDPRVVKAIITKDVAMHCNEAANCPESIKSW